MDDGQIVELFLNRDENAIRHVSEKYGSSLRKLAVNICGDGYIAEECENDAYLGAWNSIPPHEPRDYLFPYLAAITRAAAIDWCRKASRKKRSASFVELSREMEECLPSPSDTESETDGILLSSDVSDFLRSVSEEKRTVFIRRYWFGDTVSDIARRFSFSEGKVKSILHRVRKELKAYLEKEGYTI